MRRIHPLMLKIKNAVELFKFVGFNFCGLLRLYCIFGMWFHGNGFCVLKHGIFYVVCCALKFLKSMEIDSLQNLMILQHSEDVYFIE